MSQLNKIIKSDKDNYTIEQVEVVESRNAQVSLSRTFPCATLINRTIGPISAKPNILSRAPHNRSKAKAMQSAKATRSQKVIKKSQ